MFLFAFAGAAFAKQDPPASKPSAKDRWNQLSEAEREKLRKVFKEFKDLSPEDQAKIRERAKAVWQERDKIEEKLPPGERAVLESLGKDVKDQWLRSAVVELMRSRRRGIENLISREKLEDILKLPEKERDAEIRKIVNDSAESYVKKALDFAIKKNVINEDEAARIRGLSTADAIRELFELRKKLILEDLEKRPEKLAELGSPDLMELRSMSAHSFFEKLEAMRMIPRSFRGGIPKGDASAKGEGPPRGRGHGPGGRDHEHGEGRERFGPPREFDPEHHRERDNDHNDHDRQRFVDEMKSRARAALIKKGMTAEEADKELADAPPWKIMKLVGGERPPKRESSPASRRGV